MGDPIYFNSTGSFQRDELSVASYEYGVCHLAEGGCITIRVGNWPACFDMSCREGAVTVGINHFNGEFIDPGKYLLGRGKSTLAFRDVNDLSKVYYAHVKNTIPLSNEGPLEESLGVPHIVRYGGRYWTVPWVCAFT